AHWPALARGGPGRGASPRGGALRVLGGREAVGARGRAAASERGGRATEGFYGSYPAFEATSDRRAAAADRKNCGATRQRGPGDRAAPGRADRAFGPQEARSRADRCSLRSKSTLMRR